MTDRWHKDRTMAYVLRNTDALTFLNETADEVVDSIVTDPPYGTNEKSKSKVTKRGGKISEFALEWDRELPIGWYMHAARVLRPGGSLLVWTDTKRVETVWKECERGGLNPLQIVS